MRKAREIGLEVGLRYVYERNVRGRGREHTHCYNCGELLIERYSYRVLNYKIEEPSCPKCGVEIDGILR
jgi:pyruvate formate lyase activating enzyme